MSSAQVSHQCPLLLAWVQFRRHRQHRHHRHQTRVTISRPSRHPAIQTSAWMCQVVTRAMGTSCGCGNATELNHSNGVSIPGRYATHPMSRNASTQATCRMECNCTSGIVMASLSRHGASMGMLPPCIWRTPTLAWTTMAIGNPMGSHFTFGSALEIGTRSGPFGTRQHLLLFEVHLFSVRDLSVAA